MIKVTGIKRWKLRYEAKKKITVGNESTVKFQRLEIKEIGIEPFINYFI